MYDDEVFSAEHSNPSIAARALPLRAALVSSGDS
jgi:hypothetical protein